MKGNLNSLKNPNKSSVNVHLLKRAFKFQGVVIITMRNNFINQQLLNQAFLCSWVRAVCKRASFANRLWHVQVAFNNSIANTLCLPLVVTSFDSNIVSIPKRAAPYSNLIIVSYTGEDTTLLFMPVGLVGAGGEHYLSGAKEQGFQLCNILHIFFL